MCCSAWPIAPVACDRLFTATVSTCGIFPGGVTSAAVTSTCIPTKEVCQPSDVEGRNDQVQASANAC